MNVVSGVPQGSVLGPFVVFTDIPNHITSTYCLYVDPVQIDSSADANALQFY